MEGLLNDEFDDDRFKLSIMVMIMRQTMMIFWMTIFVFGSYVMMMTMMMSRWLSL